MSKGERVSPTGEDSNQTVSELSMAPKFQGFFLEDLHDGGMPPPGVAFRSGESGKGGPGAVSNPGQGDEDSGRRGCEDSGFKTLIGLKRGLVRTNLPRPMHSDDVAARPPGLPGRR